MNETGNKQKLKQQTKTEIKKLLHLAILQNKTTNTSI